ncbi:ABC transporter ATP-binding protein [Aeromicrobium sp. 9AM]|uniref:ABC transporter ATP-binding protein n=1 Tax=Aeromicrobium sp. 9AM TaxID=2653126 RepID=UPI001359AAF5|nr:ATP-binding cassette domain-containing protein [Aeromicrobium sp. 9AM]
MSFAYRGQPILTDVELRLDPGEVLAVRGRSGSGKSTLLHLLAGLLTPSDGEVAFEGRRFDQWSDRRRSRLRLKSFGVVFQNGDLIPELTVAENVALPLQLLRLAPDTVSARVRELLGQFDLGDLGDRNIDQISGGQMQRVAIARAMSHRPRVLFADEPTGSLDEETAADAVSAMIGAARALDTPLVLVTHSQAVASECDRTLELETARADPLGETRSR